MLIRKTLTALAATGLVFAGAASAANVGEAPARQASAIGEGEDLAGAGIGWIIAALVAAGVVYVIVDDDDDEEPESP